MSSAGWYPDPGGQPGLYRYWTGTAWTAAVTANPQITPPPVAPGGPAGAGQPGSGEPSRGRSVGWWLAGGAALVAVVLIAWFVTQGVSRIAGGGGGDEPGGNPTQSICPRVEETEEPTAPPQRAEGRVYGGKISYPMLGDPWSPVQGDNRVPFGRDVASQTVMLEPNYNGAGSSWVASVLVGELVAGDGFFSPKEGSEIVMKCVVGKFYGDAEVARSDVDSRALSVDGHDAWLLESHLTFDIPGLEAKGETAIVVIVDTGAESASLYYASIPDNAPGQLMQDARGLIPELTVD